jgi:hypothetical protein
MPHGRFRLFTAGLVTRVLLRVGAVAMLAFSSGASAVPVPFNITSAQFLPDAGYGVDFDETNGTLLDVRFSNGLFTPQSVVLSAVNQSFTFNFGTIDLEEPDADSGIIFNELDGLGITAKLTFIAPTGVLQSVMATGTAFLGSVSDQSVDYVVDWSPVTISFGNGGQFQVGLTDMAFSGMGLQFQTATVTLLSLSDGDGSSGGTALPEPASIALVGIGIGCAAITRRRRAKAGSSSDLYGRSAA